MKFRKNIYVIFTGISLSGQAFLFSSLRISAKILFFVSKIKENFRTLPLMKCLIFFIFGWFSYFLIALKTGTVMSELAILLARVSPNSKLSTSLLKCLLNVSASSSLLLIVLLILFKIIDSMGKAFSEKGGPTVFKNILLSETTLWSIFQRKRLWVLLSKLTQNFLDN